MANTCCGKNNGTWISIGIGVGAALGVAFDNLAFGIGLGAAFGVVMATVLNQKNSCSTKSDSKDVKVDPPN
jgi:hypothetical protein